MDPVHANPHQIAVPSDAGLFDRSIGDWRRRLSVVIETARTISTQGDPQAMVAAFASRMHELLPFDRTVALSRRGVEAPRYRITRSDLWPEAINPWTQRNKLPMLEAGLLGELLYAAEPRIIDDLSEYGGRLAGDPAAEHLAEMRSLAAIPHFTDGDAVNMVIHMRRAPGAFDREQFPELVLVSNLFGQTMHGLVLSSELRSAKESLVEQYEIVTKLSDTVLVQALDLKDYSKLLEQKVAERTAELLEANLDAVYMLAVASEAKDADTGAHVRRIQRYTQLLAAELGLAEADVRAVGVASVLHDVGKMHVPDDILKKPGPLTPAERAHMQEHTVMGERILSERPFFAAARRVARSHHENWDGTGYPDAIAGTSVPIEARIVHLADVYDALVNTRVYKPAWTPEAATKLIEDLSGRMFDPDVTAAFKALRGRGVW